MTNHFTADTILKAITNGNISEFDNALSSNMDFYEYILNNFENINISSTTPENLFLEVLDYIIEMDIDFNNSYQLISMINSYGCTLDSYNYSIEMSNKVLLVLMKKINNPQIIQSCFNMSFMKLRMNEMINIIKDKSLNSSNEKAFIYMLVNIQKDILEKSILIDFLHTKISNQELQELMLHIILEHHLNDIKPIDKYIDIHFTINRLYQIMNNCELLTIKNGELLGLSHLLVRNNQATPVVPTVGYHRFIVIITNEDPHYEY